MKAKPPFCFLPTTELSRKGRAKVEKQIQPQGGPSCPHPGFSRGFYLEPGERELPWFLPPSLRTAEKKGRPKLCFHNKLVTG